MRAPGRAASLTPNPEHPHWEVTCRPQQGTAALQSSLWLFQGPIPKEHNNIFTSTLKVIQNQQLMLEKMLSPSFLPPAGACMPC